MEHLPVEKKQKKNVDLSKLTQIQQVTEEFSVSKRVPKRETTPIIVQTHKQSQQPTISVFRQSINYFTNCINSCLKKGKKDQYTINEEQITREVEKIKKKKSKAQALLPPSSSPKLKTLVLDLDETLIYTSFKRRKNYDFSTEVEVNGKMQKIYVTKRFGLDIFLFEMSQLYELVIYTAGTKYYTDRILEKIDLQKRISHTLYRQNCTVLNGSYFLKNLNQLGRNLKQTILVDDNSMAGMLNPEIFYKIQPFHGSSHDRKLLRLIDFLKEMAVEENFNCLFQKRKEFNSRKAKVVNELKKDILAEESQASSKACFEGMFSIEQ